MDIRHIWELDLLAPATAPAVMFEALTRLRNDEDIDQYLVISPGFPFYGAVFTVELTPPDPGGESSATAWTFGNFARQQRWSVDIQDAAGTEPITDEQKARLKSQGWVSPKDSHSDSWLLPFPDLSDTALQVVAMFLVDAAWTLQPDEQGLEIWLCAATPDGRDPVRVESPRDIRERNEMFGGIWPILDAYRANSETEAGRGPSE